MNDQLRYLHVSRPPQGILTRTLGFVLTLALLAVGLMFSAVFLVLAAVAGLGIWGWLRWKTRHLRRQMAGHANPAYQAADGVIEGEAVRVDEPAAPAHSTRP